MQLAPKLQPFWFEPEFQTETPRVRFKLRPLTQQEMIEVESLYEQSDDPRQPPTSTRAAQFKAAMLAIQACDGVYDENNEPIRWPAGIDRHGAASEYLRSLICHAGLHIIVQMGGGDWDRIIGTSTEPKGPAQPAETDSVKT